MSQPIKEIQVSIDGVVYRNVEIEMHRDTFNYLNEDGDWTQLQQGTHWIVKQNGKVIHDGCQTPERTVISDVVLYAFASGDNGLLPVQP